MKKFSLLTLSVLSLVLLFSVFRTFSVKSYQTKIEPVPEKSLPIEAAVSRLSAGVRFKTVSSLSDTDANSNEFLLLNEHIRKSYPSIESKLKKTKVSNFSFFYEWQGKNPNLKPILLCAHTDVVDVDPSTASLWTRKPFGGEIQDGFVWGRGAWDDKSSVFAILESIEILIKRGHVPERSIFIAIGQDEETIYGKLGAKAITEIFKKRNIRFEYVLDEGQVIAEGLIPGIEKPIALIGIAGKGYLSLGLEVDLKEGGHSSMPPQETAIGILSSGLSQMEKNPFPLSLGDVQKTTFQWLAPEMKFGSRWIMSNLWLFGPILKSRLSEKNSTRAQLHTTSAITKISGGFKDNVLPAKAEATVNFRILQGDSHRGVLDRTEKILNDERIRLISPDTIFEPSPISSVDSIGFETIRRSIQETIPDVIVAPALVSAYTDSLHYGAVADNAYRFFPVRVKPDDVKRFHGIDERISISNYEEMIRFYLRLILNSSN
ncbi:M20 family peptidase [Leptospira adleri]|uniref:M20 family peptidase n=1 Tax=Leptospira adleri TaxID=2023186 RepID=UPI0010824F46|nr:M20 family peptidase [Leptospira adleri]TGM57080.1 M20/M25/M40 family metallo-hydrolase [Leptospira adleri]